MFHQNMALLVQFDLGGRHALEFVKYYDIDEIHRVVFERWCPSAQVSVKLHAFPEYSRQQGVIGHYLCAQFYATQ